MTETAARAFIYRCVGALPDGSLFLNPIVLQSQRARIHLISYWPIVYAGTTQRNALSLAWKTLDYTLTYYTLFVTIH